MMALSLDGISCVVIFIKRKFFVQYDGEMAP